MQLELAPYINRIISPPLRPVSAEALHIDLVPTVVFQINSQITKPQDRALLNRLVDIMVALDLRLVQDKAEDGQLFYRLDP